MGLIRTILVANDFSEYADLALEAAVDLAEQQDATIHLVHAVSLPMLAGPEMGFAYSTLEIDGLMKQAQTELDSRTAKYRSRATFAPVRIELGDARDVIDRAAKEIGADLIVIGTHGRQGIRRFLLGSVAESVVRSAPCSVLTIRSKHTKDAA
jgi:nucleotide-binding universal stress UspA family protein